MNPLGIDLLPTVQRAAEGSSRPAAQEASSGEEFLTQFLDMLFADPKGDVDLVAPPDLSSPEAQLDVLPIPEDQPKASLEEEQEVLSPGEASPFSSAEQKQGHPLSTEVKSGHPVAELVAQEVATEEVKARTESEAAIPWANVSHNESPKDTQVAAESKFTAADDQSLNLSRKASPDNERPPADLRPASEPPIQRTTERVEPGSNSDLTRRHGETNQPDPIEVRKPLDSFREASKDRPQDNSHQSSSQRRTNPASTPPALEHPVLSRGKSAASRPEPREIDAEPAGRLTETKPDRGPNRVQDGDRIQRSPENMIHKESLLKRLVAQEVAHPDKPSRALQDEVETFPRIHPDTQRAVQEPAKAAGVEKDHSSGTPTAPRPEATPILGSNQRGGLVEPAVVKEFFQSAGAENFDRIADQIIRRITLQQNGETFQLGVRLKPEFLGALHIQTVVDSDHTIRALIEAEDSTVKMLLESKIDTLVQRLDEAGIRVDRLEIAMMSSDGASSATDSNNGHSDRSPDHAQNRGTARGPNSNSELVSQNEDVMAQQVEDHNDGHIHLFV